MLHRLASFLILLCCASTSLAQQSTMSKDYWVSFLPSLDNIAPIWVLASTNTPGTKVRVTYSEDNSIDEFTISPNQPKEYRVKLNSQGATPYLMAKPDRAEEIQRRSIHIESSHPIMVQQFTDADNNVSLTMPVPTAYLGRKYVIAAFNDQQARPAAARSTGKEAGEFPSSSGGFVIIAPEDSTSVTIKAAGKLSGGLEAGQSQDIMLMRGQTYWAKGAGVSDLNDISGTHVTSDKPIATVAGAEVMRSYDLRRLENQFDFNDHIAEAMLPVEQWGTEYVGTPLTNKRGTKEDDLWGEMYRVYAAEPTELFYNNSSVGVGTYWEYPLQTAPVLFKADKPIMVVQHDYYIDFHGTNPKTPRTSNSMHLLLPRHQWANSYTFTVPKGYEQTFFYVTAHKDSVEYITASMNGAVPRPIGGMRFNGATTYTHGNYRTYTIMLGERGQCIISGPCQFQVINHGTRDNDQIKATYAYGSLVGSTFGRMESRDFKVRVDSSCGKYDITITDTAVDGDGIAEAYLMYDPRFSPPSVSTNAQLTVEKHAIGPKVLRATVTTQDPLKDMAAYVMVKMRSGFSRVVPIKQFGTKVLVAPTWVSSPAVNFGDTSCKSVSFTNTGLADIIVTKFTTKRQSFNINTPFVIKPSKLLPYPLKPGETMNIDVCFTSIDTGILHWDSLQLVTDCYTADLMRMEGMGKVATIFADDQEYGLVDLGNSETENIEISNLSTEIELTLTGYDFASDVFSIAAVDSARFPITLARKGLPGDKTLIPITYTPTKVGKDTLTMVWTTDIRPPYDRDNRKNWSMLRGESRAPLSVHNTTATSAILIRDGLLSVALADGEILRSISISNVTGAVLAVTQESNISLDGYAAGVYFVRVVTNQRDMIEKIVR